MATNLMTDLYSSMDASLREAVSKDRAASSDAGSAVSLGPPRQKLPKADFYQDSRFFHGTGGVEARYRATVQADSEADLRCLYCITAARHATIRCVSCATYDPGLRGHYCDECFKSRHPSFRAEHVHVRLKHAEEVRALRAREARTKLQSHGDDISKVMTSLSCVKKTLQVMKTDPTGDDLVKDVHRKARDAAVQLARLRRALRAPRLEPTQKTSMADSVRKSMLTAYRPSDTLPSLDGPKALKQWSKMAMWEADPQHAAASLFQQAWRVRAARSAVDKIAAQQTMKVFDAASGFYYFVDAASRETSWEPPGLLWRDGEYRAAAATGDATAKPEAMARAAAKLLSPRAHAQAFDNVLQEGDGSDDAGSDDERLTDARRARPDSRSHDAQSSEPRRDSSRSNNSTEPRRESSRSNNSTEPRRDSSRSNDSTEPRRDSSRSNDSSERRRAERLRSSERRDAQRAAHRVSLPAISSARGPSPLRGNGQSQFEDLQQSMQSSEGLDYDPSTYYADQFYYDDDGNAVYYSQQEGSYDSNDGPAAGNEGSYDSGAAPAGDDRPAYADDDDAEYAARGLDSRQSSVVTFDAQTVD
ncbi:hypothetical protein M885DRAFT_625682 [Pelagophyceae sp. CCMP2097]|nr:hypothetical protein M885DRAFT_625682 [Pelagophyceae sp. CCMP2097]